MFEVLTSSTTIINPQITNAFHDTLLNLLQLGLLGLVAGANWGLKIWLSSLHSGWKRTIADRAVKFAEQRFEGNEEKRKQAAALISAHFPRLSPDEIDHLLEEAVFNLNTQTQPTKGAPTP